MKNHPDYQSLLPLISVIILNYNHAPFLDSCINSVLNQSYRRVEILVVENGSTDSSMKVLEKFASSVTLITLKENVGQAEGRNLGIREAKGELIAFLDSDDLWKNHKLEVQQKLISSERQLVYSNATVRNSDFEYEIRSEYEGQCGRFFFSPKMPAVVLCGESSALLTRDLLNKVGAFDPILNSSSGWDFFRRCSEYTSFGLVNEPLVVYRIHEGNMSKSLMSGASDRQTAFFKAMMSSDFGTTKGFLLYLSFLVFNYRPIFRWQTLRSTGATALSTLIWRSVMLTFKLLIRRAL